VRECNECAASVATANPQCVARDDARSILASARRDHQQRNTHDARIAGAPCSGAGRDANARNFLHAEALREREGIAGADAGSPPQNATA
jgi:hypothetical protein